MLSYPSVSHRSCNFILTLATLYFILRLYHFILPLYQRHHTPDVIVRPHHELSPCSYLSIPDFSTQHFRYFWFIASHFFHLILFIPGRMAKFVPGQSEVSPYVHIKWLRLVSSPKTKVSFAKEPYKKDYILQKRLVFLRSELIIGMYIRVYAYRL